jgi:hypothetical protein
VALLSLTAPRIKSFTNQKVILMSPSVAPTVVRNGRQSVVETIAMELHARCFPWFVPIVEKIQKYLLNHVVISRCTVATASEK